MHKYSEGEIKKMLEFFIDNIYVVIGGQVFQQSVGIPMGTNCAPLLADLFLYSYEAEFIQKLLHEKKKSLAVAFNSTFRYIDDVLSINNNHFHSYVDSIYPNELEIKDTTECSTSASYLDVLLKLDTNSKLTTQLYDKWDDFNFSIVNFPYLCSNIPASPAYGVYISQLIRYARACSAYDQFLVRGSLLTKSLFHKGFKCLAYRQLSANFMVVTTILFTHTTFLWATCCLICFITIVKLFFTLILTMVHTVTDLDYGSYRLPNLEKGLTAGVIDRQGMLTPPWHLIPPLIYSEVRVRPFSDLYFLLDL